MTCLLSQLGLCLKLLSHPAVLTSNVQCVRLAAGRRILKMCCYRSRLVYNCCFEYTDISQGSVATRFRCGVIFNHSIVLNLFQILTVKKFENWPISDEVKAYEKSANFWATPMYTDKKAHEFSWKSTASWNSHRTLGRGRHAGESQFTEIAAPIRTNLKVGAHVRREKNCRAPPLFWLYKYN